MQGFDYFRNVIPAHSGDWHKPEVIAKAPWDQLRPDRCHLGPVWEYESVADDDQDVYRNVSVCLAWARGSRQLFEIMRKERRLMLLTSQRVGFDLISIYTDNRLPKPRPVKAASVLMISEYFLPANIQSTDPNASRLQLQLGKHIADLQDSRPI